MTVRTRPRREPGPIGRTVRALMFACGALAAPTAMAAGGHHALDDAVIVEPGACQVEGWLTRADAHQRLVHAGGACRIGPVELGVGADHARAGDSSGTGYQLQAKWAMEVLPGLNAGLSVAGGWAAHARPRHQVTTVAGLLTWFPRDDLAFHLNLGRDFARNDGDQDRSGAALDWTVRPGWSLTAERFVEGGSQFARAGVRWAITEAWSVDLSRAQRLRGPGASNWTLGATWQFRRP